MKSFFIGQQFTDEISFWKYVQAVNKAPEGASDGLYVIEFVSDIGNVSYNGDFYFSSFDDGEEFLDNRWFHYVRAVFEVRNGVLYTRRFAGREIHASDNLTNGKWVEEYYHDVFLEMPTEKEKVDLSQEAQHKCIKKLLKLLVIEGKKIS